MTDAITAERLVLERVTADNADVPGLLTVFNSNPDFIDASSQFVGKRTYHRSDVEMHLFQALNREGSEAWDVRTRPARELVGHLTALVPHPASGEPWMGLFLVHGDHQRAGVGTEALDAYQRHLAAAGWNEVRTAVMEACPALRAFFESRGYEWEREAADQDGRAVWVLVRRLG